MSTRWTPPGGGNAVAPSLTCTDAAADIPAGDVAQSFCVASRFVGSLSRPRSPTFVAFLAGSDARFVTGVVPPDRRGTGASSGQPPHP
jgi:meso-butanediol dehydrogenase/(S,S)-butanediol dehydrogenase/diacetyl reductase